MKKILMIALMSTVMNVAIASNQDVKDAAEELLSMSGVEKSFSADAMVANELKRNPALIPFKGIMEEFFNKYIDYEAVKPELVKLYMETFSAQEMKDIVAFYKTPAGKKVISATPELAAKVSQIGMSRIQSNIGELQAAIKEEAAKVAAESAGSQPMGTEHGSTSGKAGR